MNARSARPSVVVALLATLLVATASWAGEGLDDLGDLDRFRARFDADQGQIRLVLLLSPT